MIRFNLSIDNPWSDRWNTVWFKNGLLLKHKAWEFNAYRTHHIVNFEFHITRRCDHAGVGFEFGLLGYSLEFQIYDTRHWNYELDNWISYD